MSKRLTGGRDRRTFLKILATMGGLAAVPLPEPCSGVASSPTAAPAPTAKPAKVVAMRVGHVNPTDHWNTEALKRWADGVARSTGGGIKIDVHPGGVLGTGRTSAEGVAMGSVEAHFNDPSEYAFFNQALNILSAPFIWADRNQLQKAVRDPGILTTLYDPVIKKGIRPLALGYIGTRNVTTKDTPAKKPEDLTGTGTSPW